MAASGKVWCNTPSFLPNTISLPSRAEIGSLASTWPKSVMRASGVGPRAPTDLSACCAASSATGAGGSGNGNARTCTIPMAFICRTTPSIGTRAISGDENCGKKLSNTADEYKR
eukprot:scaffold67210_cov30-Tisochrysis_lutea.AAC.2